MSTAELVYFDGRGRAEMIRIISTACGIKLKEVLLKTREDYLAMKPDLLFGQVPLLRIDGMDIVQTNAIIRHIARTHNLDGKSEAEKVRVDEYYEGTRDFIMSFLVVGFTVAFDKICEHAKPAVDRYMPIYEKILRENGSKGYLVGDSLTLADLGLFEVLLFVDECFGKTELGKYPEINRFLETIRKQSFHDEYITNVRKPKNSEEYVSTVKKVLAF